MFSSIGSRSKFNDLNNFFFFFFQLYAVEILKKLKLHDMVFSREYRIKYNIIIKAAMLTNVMTKRKHEASF